LAPKIDPHIWIIGLYRDCKIEVNDIFQSNINNININIMRNINACFVFILSPYDNLFRL